MEFKDLKILNRFFKKNTNKFEISNIDGFWKIMIIIFSFINIIGALGGLYVFLKINQGEVFIPSSEVGVLVESVDEETLRNIISVFENRETILLEMISQDSMLIDR